MTVFDEPAPPLPVVHGLTPEQEVAVGQRTGGLLVSANAGSGKTRVLVERIVAAVLEDGLAAGSLLAITFTEKAAGELRARARRAFLDRGALEAARDVESAWISTIHGFCARVLRAHAVAAGLDPAFVVLDEATSRALRGEAWDAVLAAFLDATGPDADERLELVAGWGADRLRLAVVEVHDVLRARGLTGPRLPPYAPPRTVAAACVALDAARGTLLAELEGAGEGASVRAARDALGACALVVAAPEDVHAGALGALTVSKRGRALQTPAADAYRARLEELSQALVDRDARGAHHALDELLQRFAAAYAERKGLRGALDFEDLELRARDLLAAQPAIARGYGERFARVMVDELQDTNALQLELIAALGVPDVFLVGDALQSIYGFRQADVEVFRGLRRRHAAEGTARTLTANFRSHPDLLELVNGAFGADVHDDYVPLVAGLGGAGADGEPPRAELLLVDRAWDDPTQPAAALVPALEEGATPGTRPSRLAEARAIARRLRELVDAGTPAGSIAVLARTASELGTVERALQREGLATLASAGRGYWLRQPVQDLCSWLQVLANPHDDLALLGVLASPLGGLGADALAHVAAVARATRRAPWEVLDDPALLDRLERADALRLRRVVARLLAERADAPRHRLDELIERAVRLTGYDLHVLRLPGGRRRLANVHKLEGLAAAHEASAGRDLRGFLDHVRAEVDAEAREAEAPIELGGLQAVQLMTIHAAKGLEFGTVVVCDLGRQANGTTPDVLVGGSQVGLRLVRLGAPTANALAYDELRARAQAADRAEERRVLHVALTRAEERLILAGAVDLARGWPRESTTAPVLSWLGPRLGEDLPARLAAEGELLLDELRPGGRVRLLARAVSATTAPETLGLAAPAEEQLALDLGGAADPPPAPTPPSARRPARAAATGVADDALDDLPPAPAAVAPPVHLSYTSLTDHAACGYRYYLRRVLALPEAEPPPEALALEAHPEGLDPRLRGTLIHALLERAPDLTAPPGPADLEAVLAADGRAPLEAAQAADVLALAGAFAPTALARRARDAPTVLREAGFDLALHAAGASADAPLLTGVVDLLALEADGTALVLDYKSDGLPDDIDASGLERRVEAHYAALQAGAARVEVHHVHLERPDLVVRATYAAADAGALRAWVLDRAAPLLRGEFPVSPEPHLGLCARCPGRGTLCSWPEEESLRVLPET